MNQIRTIGYERATLGDFIATLCDVGVECVLDIRAVPVSRKPGFSKNALKDALEKVGIEYIHLRALGDPKPGRDAAKAGRLADFRQIYQKHLRTRDAQDAMMVAAGWARSVACCLLCFEREPNHCHRSLVAFELSARHDIAVEHLSVTEKVAVDGGRARKRRTSAYLGKGRTAAQPTAR